MGAGKGLKRRLTAFVIITEELVTPQVHRSRIIFVPENVELA
ncbi:MAG: hypothetical protein ACUVX8_01170 [Candidatus Zipacnadales bacterium]